MKVYAHTIGTDQSEDVLVFEELDDTVFVDITSTKDNVNRSLDYPFLCSSYFRNMSRSMPIHFLHPKCVSLILNTIIRMANCLKYN